MNYFTAKTSYNFESSTIWEQNQVCKIITEQLYQDVN